MNPGHIAPADGLKVDPATVEAIVGMPTPANKTELQRLLAWYGTWHSTYPMSLPSQHHCVYSYDRTSSATQNEQDEAVSRIRTALSNAATLQYYDVDKPATIQCDESQRGLGSCLLQQGRPVAYALRVLTSAEENYSQIEETLAICFSCSKFHQYIYRKKTTIHTDH